MSPISDNGKRSQSPSLSSISREPEEPPHKRKIVVKQPEPPEPPSIDEQRQDLLDKLIKEDTKLAKSLAERDYQESQIKLLKKKITLDKRPNPQTYELLQDFEERREKISREIIVLRTRQDALKRKLDTLPLLEKQERDRQQEEVSEPLPKESNQALSFMCSNR